MPGPSTLGGILNEIALSRIGFAQEGDVIRQKLWSAVAEGPQDEPSLTRRVESVLNQHKVTPSLATKLYLSEVEANRGSGTQPIGDAEQAIETRNKTILRHTLRNIASNSTGRLRNKIEGGLLAADLDYQINPLVDTGKAPGFDWSETPKNRPLIDLMVRAEHANPGLFSRAVSAAATSLSTGSNNQIAELARLLDEDGHPMTAAITRFVIGTGLPSKTAVDGELPEDLRHYLTIMYAEALAAGQVQAFTEFLGNTALDLQYAGVDMKARQQAHLAAFRAAVARGRGDFSQSPVPKVGLQPVEGNDRINNASADFARTWTELMEDAKRNNKEANTKLAMSAWLQKAKSFAKTVQAPVPRPQQPQPQPDQAPEEFLNNFYGSLVDPAQIEQEKTQFFLQKDRIGSMSNDDPNKAKLLKGLGVLQDKLLRLYALQQALSGKAKTADEFENRALTAITDNRQAITAARQAGQTTVILKDPTRYEVKNGVTVFQSVPRKLPVATALPVAPMTQPPASQSVADKLKSAVDKTVARGVDQADALQTKLEQFALEQGGLQKELNRAIAQKKQEKLAWGTLQAAKVGAASHEDLKPVMLNIRKALEAEVRSMNAPMADLVMTHEMKLAALQEALTTMGSTIDANMLLKLPATLDANVKAALVKQLPSDETIAKFIANTPVQVGEPSADAGMNVTELYYVVNKIMALKNIRTKQDGETGGAGDTAKAKLGIETKTPEDNATSVIEEALYGGGLSQPSIDRTKVLPHIPLGAGSSNELLSTAEKMLVANAGRPMPAEIIRIIDPDSVVMGVCGYDDAGQQYCIGMHTRLQAVSGVEKSEGGTKKLQNIIEGAVDVSMRLNPTQPVQHGAGYARWLGIIYAEMPDGTIRKVNVELNELGKKAQASGTTKEVGYDTKHQYPYPNELPEQSIADSLGGTGNRDYLFGKTSKLYEGAVPVRAPYEGTTKTTVTPTLRK